MTAAWKTALVTGASSGIGREIARQLAREGTDLVIVARDEERLTGLAREIGDTTSEAGEAGGNAGEAGGEAGEAGGNAGEAGEAGGKAGGEARDVGDTTGKVGEAGGKSKVEVLPADLADSGQLATVEARLADEDRPIDLLVNNAGFGTYGRFADLDRDKEEAEIRLNVVALVRLTHAALGPMLARGRGAIMNISSIAGLQPTPGNATYGATKAFVTSFSEAVHGELAGTGVTLTAVLPGFTRTEFQERAGTTQRSIPRLAWRSAEAVAAEALAATRAGKPWVVTGRLNKVAVAAASPVPRSLRRRIAARVVGRF